MSDTVIKVENLSKKYRIGSGDTGYRTFRETLVDSVKAPFQGIARLLNLTSDLQSQASETFWALKDVSFEVKQGEVVGIIGRNGAGKSTLLKILSKITEPTEGRVELRGRIGSLLEVGTGFHPELTGHENVYLYGAILGMDRWEITRKFDEIVAFAEMEKFINTPVKHYSSGMYMRLAFAVAAHLETEILLVDEVLAVGDAAFQKKCLGKMDDVAKEGRTVLFVSHNMVVITALCVSAILLDYGKIFHQGASRSVVQKYMNEIHETSSLTILAERRDRKGDGSIRIVSLRFGTESQPTCGYLVTGEDGLLEMSYECQKGKSFRNVEIAMGIRKQDQTPMLYLGTKIVHQDIDFVNGLRSSVCKVKKLPLEPGRYSINAEIKQNGIIVDYIQSAAFVDVTDGDYYGTGTIWLYGGFLCDYSWKHLEGE
ncbi:protein containing ABC transporter-like domain [sediment metagenome]|uniref:Protein containing ABC transporter-like domain n=1 Tax=sediment metagenome TaxID=749907 RepID=D9PM60_9ZZZZ